MSTPANPSDAHRPDVDDRSRSETSLNRAEGLNEDTASRNNVKQDESPAEIELEPGSRSARLYELLAVDLWWSLGMMGAAGVIATVLFTVTALGPLRVAGIAVGLGTATVYAGRLIWLRGLTETRADEWAVIAVEAAALIALTETTAVILDVVGGGLL